MLRRFFTAGGFNHPIPPRAAAASTFKEEFDRLVGKENVLDTSVDPYTIDWTRKHVGGNASTLVVFPRSTAHVSAILSFCHMNNIGVVPQGDPNPNPNSCLPYTATSDMLLYSLTHSRDKVGTLGWWGEVYH